ALDTPHILYHDFSDEVPPTPEVILPPGTDEYGRKASPVDPLDDIVSQACALSEAESTVLILDQLQAADFREHIRIHRLIRDRLWLVRDAPYYANPRNMLLFLISEASLYHSLQRESFRVWVGRVSERRVTLSPAELGLKPDAVLLLDALNDLFRAVDASPTRSEIARLLDDLASHVQTEEHLIHALFGRCEGIDRDRMKDPELRPVLSRVIEQLRGYLEIEQIVVGSAREDVESGVDAGER
ncbi:MAG: hypothetical protein EOM22_19985, partial [Gammaproteobacteria bacterium]|nr:hypothetical protein [Gammaproteobacteria bacterium]